LDSEEIEKLISKMLFKSVEVSKLEGWTILEYGEIESTNLEARRILESYNHGKIAIIAGQQTRGMGRMGRRWESLPGKSLLASIVIEGKGINIVQAVSTAAIEAIRSYGAKGPQIKWPNDFVYGMKKVGGILTEVVEKSEGTWTIAGLGLNLNYTEDDLDFPSRLPPTSTLIEERMRIEPKVLLARILDRIDERLNWQRSFLHEEYVRNLAFLGEELEIKLAPNLPTIQGKFSGVNENGSLILETGTQTITISAGEITCSQLLSPAPGNSSNHESAPIVVPQQISDSKT